MFDFIANSLSLAISVLLPTFLTYKALQTVPEPTTTSPSAATAATHDFLSFIQNVNAYANNQNTANQPPANPTALLRPWLTYWITLSLVNAALSLLSPFTAYLPLFAWLRLLLHIYLLIPGTAERLYQETIKPFLTTHEAQIEDFITQTHASLRGKFLDTLTALFDAIRRLGGGSTEPRAAPGAPTVPGAADNTSYVQMLLARFTVASSQAGRPASQAPSSSSQQQQQQQTPQSAADAVAATSQVVRDLYGKFKAQNVQAGTTAGAQAAGGVRRNRSEMEFETISQEDAMGSSTGNVAAAQDAGRSTGGGGWGGWIFGGGSGSGSGAAASSSSSEGRARRRSRPKGE